MTSENKAPIPEAVVNQILDQSKIVEVINDFQPLSITDELITGICPFCGSNEFTINEHKNFFHCFAAEGYSEDENQSFKKFPQYELWRDGFLAETLKTCVEYLKPGRWLCWNVADVSFDGKFHPLERDAVDIHKSMGTEYRHRYKMLMGLVTHSEISSRTRVPTSNNYCSVRGRFYKYEPIFCFYKPKS